MSILTVIQDAMVELGLTSPTTVFTNTDATVTQFLKLLQHDQRTLADLYPWPEQNKEYSFTLATSTASYALPADINFQLFQTYWDRTRHWRLVGPLSADEWQAWKSGVTAPAAYRMFRIKSMTDAQFFVTPTPTSSDNGATMIFEYQTATCFKPKTWVTATVFAANSYSFYNGNIYKTTAGGTTGATPPTHTSGSVSDGTVTWTYQTAAYETVTADTDSCVLSEHLAKMGIKWRWRQHNSLEFQSFYSEWNNEFERLKTALLSAKELSMGRQPFYQFIGSWSVPDSGYG